MLVADAILENSDYKKLRKERYASFDSGKGADFETGKLKLEDLQRIADELGEPGLTSGKQELYENILYQFM